jgi:hypothetical protein
MMLTSPHIRHQEIAIRILKSDIKNDIITKNDTKNNKKLSYSYQTSTTNR